MLDIKLRFWLTATETQALVQAATAYWTRLENALRWPLEQLDPLTCIEGILDLLAYQRDIERFKNEPLDLYRKRVKYALINAEDAGSKAGFIRIFERLGIGYLEIEERVDPVEWDVVILKLSSSQIAQNTELLQYIIYKYGRTCRRYTLTVVTPIDVITLVNTNSNDYLMHVAKLEQTEFAADVAEMNNTSGNSWAMHVAQL